MLQITYFSEIFVKYGLARITTPFFFLVSAYLLFLGARSATDGYPLKLRKRVGSLLVPYLLWSIWGFLLVTGLQLLPFLRGFSERETVADSGSWEWARLIFWNTIPHQLWFLRDLMMLVVASPLVYLAMRARWCAWPVLGACCLAWFVWFDVRESRALLFFCLGTYFAIHRPSLTTQPWQPAAALVAWLMVITLDTLFIMDHGHEHAVLYNTAILLGLATLWTGYDQVAGWFDNRACAFMSSYTFFVYCAHEPLDTLARKAITLVLGQSDVLILPIFVLTALSVFSACLIGAWGLERFATPIYNALSGGRGSRRAVVRTAARFPGSTGQVLAPAFPSDLAARST